MGWGPQGRGREGQQHSSLIAHLSMSRSCNVPTSVHGSMCLLQLVSESMRDLSAHHLQKDKRMLSTWGVAAEGPIRGGAWWNA